MEIVLDLPKNNALVGKNSKCGQMIWALLNHLRQRKFKHRRQDSLNPILDGEKGKDRKFHTHVKLHLHWLFPNSFKTGYNYYS